MKSIISINEKFQTIEPKKLIEMILNSKYTEGLEIFVDPKNDFMMNYMENLVNLCKENNVIFQVHGDSSLDMTTQRFYLDKLSRYSDYLGYPINVVLHPLTKDTKEESINESIEYFNEILKYINPEKIKISVENLNDFGDMDRLNKIEMLPIMTNDDRLYMTYDIGHEIAEFGNITDINPILIDRISNVHIHSNNIKNIAAYDHRPIRDDNEEFEQVLKGILFLKHLNYDGPIAFEYDLYECNGNSIIEKTLDYLASIDDISEHME